MSEDVLLSPDTYAVYVRVPEVWWDEQEAIGEIATVLHQTRGSVRRRLHGLLASRLIEKRRRQTIEPSTEIRRIGKPE